MTPTRDRRSSVAAALSIRPSEGILVGRVAALFAILEAARGTGEVGAEAQLLARFGPTGLPDTLPYLIMALGLLGLGVSLGYALGLARIPRQRLFIGILLVVAGLLVGLRVALAAGQTSLIPVVWLVVNASSALGLTIGWTVAGASFDARQAKRLFPILTGAAIVGSFSGTLAAGPLARLAGVETLFLVQAVLLLVAATILWRAPTMRERAGRVAAAVGAAGGTTGSVVRDLRAGFDVVAHSPLMRLVAVAYVLLAVLMFSVTYPFQIAASRAYPDAVELASVLGLLQTAITAVAFVVSLTLANRVYARAGIAAGALALPLVYLAGFGLWLVQFSFVTAAGVRAAQQITQRGISNAAWSAFYNVIPADRRALAMAFNDGVPGQLGTILSGVLLLLASGMAGLEPIFWLGLVTASVGTIVVLGVRRGYPGSLLDALRSGLGEQVLEGGPGLPAAIDSPDLRSVLVAALDDDDVATRRMAVALLGRTPVLSDAERDRIGRLVDDPAPSVRGEVAVLLASDPLDDRATTIIASLLAADDDASRLAGLDAAARVPSRGSAATVAHLAEAGSPVVVGAAIRSIAARPDGRAVLPDAALVTALAHQASPVRRAAAAALAARPDVESALVVVLRTGPADAQDAALEALRTHALPVRDDLLAWARAQIDRAEVLHRARASLDGLRADRLEGDLLATVVGQRARRAEDRAIAALVAVGAPTAGGLMRRSLRSNDPDFRAQAIEALDTLGERRLGGALAACLEAAHRAMSHDVGATLAGLGHDDDDWIRALSSRILAAERVAAEGRVPVTDQAIAGLDTMLILRRVPLFADLEPEDLQRIALVATERDHGPSVVLMREGEPGDDLFVITEGSVRVVQAGDDGTERYIRRYGPGEHIGELAVLRDRPRAATVIADEAGVHGFSLDGESLRAILRERPDAAMAMLATLAERISTQ